MRIYVQNLSRGEVTDEEALRVCAAIQKQIDRHYYKYWSWRGFIKYTGNLPPKPGNVSRRDDAVIYLQNEADVAGALGYHDVTNKGLPYGFVFLDIAAQIGEPWSVTFSHEVLELLGDVEVNLLAIGPHPTANRNVLHWYEMCDAVQNETYDIDGVTVSNFVLPLYFTSTAEEGGQNDYLNTGLKSFGVNPGGYIGFYDPTTGQHTTFSRTDDLVAKRRLGIKEQAGLARRGARYQDVLPPHPPPSV